MEDRMNIYQKLGAITAELEKVGKNLIVGVGKNAYKAVREGDVLSAVKPLEAQYGVYSYPFARKVLNADTEVTTSTYDGVATEKKQRFMRIETTYRFINTDNPVEYVDITTYGDGVDANDKAPGKAMTYSDKYALLKAYKIETGEDADLYPSEESKGNKTMPYKRITEYLKTNKKFTLADVTKVVKKAYDGKVINDLTEKEVCEIIERMEKTKNEQVHSDECKTND